MIEGGRIDCSRERLDEPSSQCWELSGALQLPASLKLVYSSFQPYFHRIDIELHFWRHGLRRNLFNLSRPKYLIAWFLQHDESILWIPLVPNAWNRPIASLVVHHESQCNANLSPAIHRRDPAEARLRITLVQLQDAEESWWAACNPKQNRERHLGSCRENIPSADCLDNVIRLHWIGNRYWYQWFRHYDHWSALWCKSWRFVDGRTETVCRN